MPTTDLRSELLPRALAAIRRVCAARPELAVGAAEVARRLREQRDQAWWQQYGARVIEEATIMETAAMWESELAMAG